MRRNHIIEQAFFDELSKTAADLNPAVWGSLMGGILAPTFKSKTKSVLGGLTTGALGTALANLGNFGLMDPITTASLMTGGSILGGISSLLKHKSAEEKDLIAKQVGFRR